MPKSPYCTDLQHEEIVKILEEWIRHHPNPDKEWQIGFKGDSEPLTAKKMYESIRDLTPGGVWFLKEFKRLADEKGLTIVDVVRIGLPGPEETGCHI